MRSLLFGRDFRDLQSTVPRPSDGANPPPSSEPRTQPPQALVDARGERVPGAPR
jgi:hypothetical protein